TVGAFVSRKRHRGLAVVVSDCYDRSGFEPALDLLRHNGFDAHVVQVYDPAEADPPLRGDIDLFDVERQTKRKVTVTPAHQGRYRELFTGYQGAMDAYCKQHGLGCAQTSTAVPFDEFVFSMMRAAGAVH